METDSYTGEGWNILGFRLPKNEVVYLSQTIILYIVIITCIVNLSISNRHSELWVGLLSSSIGYMLPNPNVKGRKVVINNGPSQV